MYHVAAFAHPQSLATSITLPMEILQAASQMASIEHRGRAQINFQLAATDLKVMKLSSGLLLKPDILIDKLPPLDLLLVPAIWRNPLPTVHSAEPLLAWLRERAQQGTRICGVGTGSFLLAEAGLLAHKPATTHWNYFSMFRKRYPQVELKTRHLITQSDNIYCAGSVNSIADLTLHFVEEWFGATIARALENQFSPEIRRSFQAAAYQNEADSSHHDELIAEAQQWLRQRLDQSVVISALAESLDIHPRTLNRRFKQATGITPIAYLQQIRIATAKDLLRHSNLTVGDIGWQVGLQDSSHFSALFRKHSGMSPLNYRQASRGKLFSPSSAAAPGKSL